MTAKLATTILLALIAAPAASASWSVESSDTGDGQLTVWNDYWNDRTSHMGDVRAFNLTIQAPESGSYAWSIPEEAGGRPNPLRLVFSTFTVRDAGGASLGDLVEAESLPASFGDREDREFQIRFRIAELSATTLQAVREEVEANRMHYNQSVRQDEVHGWLRLAQVDEPEADATGTSVHVQHALNVAMVLDLPGEALQIHSVDTGGGMKVVTIDGQRYAVVEGPSYEANDDSQALLNVTGDLRNRSIRFFIDEPGTPVLGHDGKPAMWTPGRHDELPIRLPGGQHRLIYLVPLDDDDPGFQGTVTVHGLDGSTTWSDDVSFHPQEETTHWWLLIAVLVVLVAAFGVLLGRRIISRSRDSTALPAVQEAPPRPEATLRLDPEEIQSREVLRF